MAWDGYYRFGDDEFINTSRLAAYARSMGLYWVKDLGESALLPTMLGDSAYTNPIDDGAPWYDPNEPTSAEFLGILPLEVTGIEDSSREASVFEFTGNGGRTFGIRNSTKEVLFSLMLVATTDAGAEYGHRWLKRVVQPHQCVSHSTAACEGETLLYSAHRPRSQYLTSLDLDGGHPGTTQWERHLSGGGLATYDGGGVEGTNFSTEIEMEWLTGHVRRLRKTTAIRGPLVTGKRSIAGRCGGALWAVSMTLRVDDPFEYSPTVPVLRDVGPASPYVEGLSGDWGSLSYTWQACPKPVTTPIFDPNCRPLVPPPGPPRVGRGCFDIATGTWGRDYALIPATTVPLWDEARPVITVRAGESEVRMLRLRMYPGGTVPSGNCGEVAGVVLQYIPAGAEVVVDCSRERVFARVAPGQALRPADSLAANESGGPVDWFGLSCGQGYYFSLDWAGSTRPDVEVDVDVIARTA